jgi:hypothetical protein
MGHAQLIQERRERGERGLLQLKENKWPLGPDSWAAPKKKLDWQAAKGELGRMINRIDIFFLSELVFKFICKRS